MIGLTSFDVLDGCLPLAGPNADRNNGADQSEADVTDVDGRGVDAGWVDVNFSLVERKNHSADLCARNGITSFLLLEANWESGGE